MTYVKVISKDKWVLFETQRIVVVLLARHHINKLQRRSIAVAAALTGSLYSYTLKDELWLEAN